MSSRIEEEGEGGAGRGSWPTQVWREYQLSKTDISSRTLDSELTNRGLQIILS